MTYEPEIAKPETWQKRIDQATAGVRDWIEKAARIEKIYCGELTASGTNAQGAARFNILYSNIGILAPATYQQPPRPDVRRRFTAENPIADAAAGIIQKTLEVQIEKPLNTQIRRTVKDMLVAGRGVMRVRWTPEVQEIPLKDAYTGAPVIDEDGQPVTRPQKVAEALEFEHAYWQDFLHEPARSWDKVGWIAFRHYFSKPELRKHFADDPKINNLLDNEDWRRSTFIHQPGAEDEDRNGDNQVGKGAEGKALVWECWDKESRQVVWFAPGTSPQILRVDEDPLGLEGFYPCPAPLMAVERTETTKPVAEYSIYQDLAAEIDSLTERIDAIAERLKVRGAYVGSIGEMDDILDGDDGEMVPIDATTASMDLNKAIWIVPVDRLIQVLNSLYLAREQAKQALYEVTGISDVLRGASNANETATAQRIKGNFGTLRIDDRRRMLNAFLAELMNISGEIVATKFSAHILQKMTGEEVPPQLEEWLRQDAMREALIDIETDSTIAADEQADQESAAKLTGALAQAVQALGSVIAQAQVPPEAVAALLKLILRPFKGSRDLIEILDRGMQQASKQPQQPPQPTPAEQLEAMRLEVEKLQAQVDGQKATIEGQVAPLEAQADIAKARATIAQAAATGAQAQQQRIAPA